MGASIGGTFIKTAFSQIINTSNSPDICSFTRRFGAAIEELLAASVTLSDVYRE